LKLPNLFIAQVGWGEWAFDVPDCALAHVRAAQGGPGAIVLERFLDQPDVGACPMQVCSATVPQAVERNPLPDFGRVFGPMKNLLQTPRTVRPACVLPVKEPVPPLLVLATRTNNKASASTPK
jgi:hypothetical protein